MFFYRILAFRRADFPHATRAVLAVLRLVERHARHSTIALMSHFARSVVGLHTHCVQSSIFVEVARSCALYVLSFRDCIPQGSLRYATSASFLKLPPVAIKQESCRTHQNPLPCLAHTRAPRVSSLLYRFAITRSTALCESTINDTKCEKTSEKYRALPKDRANVLFFFLCITNTGTTMHVHATTLPRVQVIDEIQPRDIVEDAREHCTPREIMRQQTS